MGAANSQRSAIETEGIRRPEIRSNSPENVEISGPDIARVASAEVDNLQVCGGSSSRILLLPCDNTRSQNDDQGLEWAVAGHAEPWNVISAHQLGGPENTCEINNEYVLISIDATSSQNLSAIEHNQAVLPVLFAPAQAQAHAPAQATGPAPASGLLHTPRSLLQETENPDLIIRSKLVDGHSQACAASRVGRDRESNQLHSPWQKKSSSQPQLPRSVVPSWGVGKAGTMSWTDRYSGRKKGNGHGYRYRFKPN